MKKVYGLGLIVVFLMMLTNGIGYAQDDCTSVPGRQYRGGRNAATPCPLPSSGGMNYLPPATEGELSAEVIAAMTAGLMDEYHAYAVYGQVIEQFGTVRPFTAIQRSEAQHISAWSFIFERYGIPVPAAPTTVTVPALTSLAAACQVAADAEIANFNLYDEMLVTLQAYPDMVQVVTQLRNASEYNHLVAFERCASR